MKPELKLTPDAFLIKDLQMPQFYSLQFEFRIDKRPETGDKGYLILGLTDGTGDSGKPGYREPSFGIRHPDLVMMISSGVEKTAKSSFSNKYNEWLSFILKFLTNAVDQLSHWKED